MVKPEQVIKGAVFASVAFPDVTRRVVRVKGNVVTYSIIRRDSKFPFMRMAEAVLSEFCKVSQDLA